MKRDFPFTLAFGVAIMLHLVLAIAVKNRALIAASPPPATRAPVTMRFVEVPPGAKTIEQRPNSKYLSDANRKAGPLVPAAPKTSASARRPAPSVVKPAARQEQNASRAIASNTAQPSSTTPLREQHTSDSGTIPARDAARESVNKPDQGSGRLAKSLGNLDQFIGKGSDSGSGDGSADSGGQVPVDSGSGVFFDTQGFDLGPWANRVIAMVRSNWLVPVTADLGMKGVVSVSFQVARSGKILNPQIISSSKIPSYDQAALNALTASNPFPALPADFPRPVLPAVFRFYYNTPVPE